MSLQVDPGSTRDDLGMSWCVEAFTSGRPAVIHDATIERRSGEIALTYVEVHIRSGLSVPVELGGGPIGTLDVYAAEPRDWDQSEVSALQAYAGVVASLLAAAVQAQVKARLAAQLQVALEIRVLIEQAKGALMVARRSMRRPRSNGCPSVPAPRRDP